LGEEDVVDQLPFGGINAFHRGNPRVGQCARPGFNLVAEFGTPVLRRL
jgi:hypothetical protein